MPPISANMSVDPMPLQAHTLQVYLDHDLAPQGFFTQAHFTDVETEGQQGEGACLQPHGGLAVS